MFFLLFYFCLVFLSCLLLFCFLFSLSFSLSLSLLRQGGVANSLAAGSAAHMLSISGFKWDIHSTKNGKFVHSMMASNQILSEQEKLWEVQARSIRICLSDDKKGCIDLTGTDLIGSKGWGSGCGRLLNILMISRMLDVGSGLGFAGAGVHGNFGGSASLAGGVLGRVTVGDERQTMCPNIFRFHKVLSHLLNLFHFLTLRLRWGWRRRGWSVVSVPWGAGCRWPRLSGFGFLCDAWRTVEEREGDQKTQRYWALPLIFEN